MRLQSVTNFPLNVTWKAILALVFPSVGTVILALLDQVLSPDLDPTLKVAIVGLVNALLAALGAYIGKPGETVIMDDNTPGIATTSATAIPPDEGNPPVPA
jgi:MFS-type transporter involved in bile tolerance (Atg22 family)